VVEDVKNASGADTKSGTIEQIEDISAKMNADIREASRIEAKQKEEDEKNGLVFGDEEEEIFKITEVKSTNKPLLFGLAVLGVFGITFLVLKNKKREPDAIQEEELNNGTLKSVRVDSSGMLEVE